MFGDKAGRIASLESALDEQRRLAAFYKSQYDLYYGRYREAADPRAAFYKAEYERAHETPRALTYWSQPSKCPKCGSGSGFGQNYRDWMGPSILHTCQKCGYAFETLPRDFGAPVD